MEIKLIDPHTTQQPVLDASLSDEVFFVVACIGRQWGKTLLAENLAIYWAINFPGSIIYWVSPTDSQAQKVYKEILNSIIESGSVEHHKMPKGDTEIVFKTKSKIMFRSAASEDSLRGQAVNYMIIDEAAFIKKDTLDQILLPMLSVKGKKCYISSTPKGKNWFYDYYIKGLSEPKYKSFRYSTYDSPFVDDEMIKIFRNSLPPTLFKQEIEAEFVDSSSVFNNLDELMILNSLEEPLQGGKYYGGIDIGLINDASVLSIIDSNGDLVKYYRWTHIESPKLIQNIIDVANKWNFEKLYIENNNQGLPIYQDLKSKIRIEQFNTNSRTKPEIINNLIHLFNTKAIRLVKDELLKLELSGFIFKQNDLGTIKFMADYGYNDDMVMSLAIARECFGHNQFNINAAQIFSVDRSSPFL